MTTTVKSLFAAAATIHFDEILVQNLLSKNYVLLRLLFKGGYYLRAATNNDFTVFSIVNIRQFYHVAKNKKNLFCFSLFK